MRSPSKPFAHQGGVVVLAHRGFSGRYPENTMPAFEKAAELPIDGLEMDIHATKDDVLVVSHNAKVDRTTNGHGRIPSFTLAELKQLDAGYNFTPDGGQTYPFRGQGITIPTMEEVLERFPDLWLNVDIKQHETKVVNLFCDLIYQHDAAEQMAVGSFSSETIEEFRAVCRQVVSLASLSEIIKLYLMNALFLNRFFHDGGHAMQIPPKKKKAGIPFTLASPNFIKAAHRHNMAVHLWTLNDAEKMRRYVDMGVDGIITNYPDRALKVLDRLPTEQTETA